MIWVRPAGVARHLVEKRADRQERLLVGSSSGAQDFGVPAAEVGQRVNEASLAAPLARRPAHPLPPQRPTGSAANRVADGGPARHPPRAPLRAQRGRVGPQLCREAHSRHPAPRASTGPSQKCLLLYHYFLPPVWGFISVRLETWFPFPVHISPHGREWLAPPMDGAGIRYRRHYNCFTSVENRERAPALPNQ